MGSSEAAVLAAGYAPSIGFLHRGKARSFVYDIADIYKFETVVPAAFETAAAIAKGKGSARSAERLVRIACRDLFRRTGILEKIIPSIEEILKAGGIDPPNDAPEAADPAIPSERRPAMMVIVVENVPPRLRGRLSLWLAEVRAGVYVGVYGRRVRERIWEETRITIGDGNAVIAWTAPTDSGFEFECIGKPRDQRRGLTLVKFKPVARVDASRHSSPHVWSAES